MIFHRCATQNVIIEHKLTGLAQMMFVSGETSDASVETTSMIESIVQQQVMEMLKRVRSFHEQRNRPRSDSSRAQNWRPGEESRLSVLMI
jgi:uncharacterized protein YecA (UPF0149 family)